MDAFEKTEPIAVCTLPAEEERPALYYRLERRTVRGEGLCRFAFAIVCQTEGDGACVEDLTSQEETAREIFSRMVRGGVTPCCFYEVLQDLIEDYL